MEKNIPLIEKVLAHVEADPKHHDQDIFLSLRTETDRGEKITYFSPWSECEVTDRFFDVIHGCGTTACIAGWATIFTAPEGTKYSPGGVLLLPDGTAKDIGIYAAEQLGLDGDETNLFYRDRNTAIRRLKEFINE